MASYYKNLKIVNIEMDKKLKNLPRGQEFNIDLLVYDITLTFEISELYVRKRLKLIAETGLISFVGNNLGVRN